MNYMQMWYRLKKDLLESEAEGYSYRKSVLEEIVKEMDQMEVKSMEDAQCELKQLKQLLASVVAAK